MTVQQYRSHFLAQLFLRRFSGGGEGEASVAITADKDDFAVDLRTWYVLSVPNALRRYPECFVYGKRLCFTITWSLRDKLSRII